jgi:putative phosphoserine phosphatase / 1-acylglycerol-3-phosphate O-acyltransferase
METTSSKDNNNRKSYIAFFDLDRTVTKAISGKELAKSALRKGFLSYTNLLFALYSSLAYKFNLKEEQKIVDEMVRWVKDLTVQELSDLCTEVIEKTMLPSVYEEARVEIKSHKEKKGRVVLLSSALTPICREIVKNLEMDDFVCSDLEIINSRLTGHPAGKLCFGPEKAVRLISYCEKHGSNPSDNWYYGDSISDLHVLKTVGNPVCVNPDKKLRKEAVERNWKILRWTY